MPANTPNPDSKPRATISGGLATYVQAERLMQIALLLPSSVFICWLGGVGLDHLFHQKWIEIVGILFGGVAGLVGAARMAMDASKNAAGEDATGAAPAPSGALCENGKETTPDQKNSSDKS